MPRWGGEEFLILLPETNLKGAVLRGNKIRKLISAKPIIHEGQEIHVTMSFGVSEYNGETPIEKTIDLADQRLYLAKIPAEKKSYRKTFELDFEFNLTGRTGTLSYFELRTGFAHGATTHF